MVKSSVNSLKFEKLKAAKVKYLINYLERCYDCDCSGLNQFKFYINNAGKVFISTVDVDKLSLKRINIVGLYFGTFHDEYRFRLSIDGSKFIEAKKNFVEIDEKVLKSYLAAENLFIDEAKISGDGKAEFLIVKCKGENIGCVSKKEKFLLNYVPKARKLDFNKVF